MYKNGRSSFANISSGAKEHRCKIAKELSSQLRIGLHNARITWSKFKNFPEKLIWGNRRELGKKKLSTG